MPKTREAAYGSDDLMTYPGGGNELVNDDQLTLILGAIGKMRSILEAT
jgi:hypothetical protein